MSGLMYWVNGYGCQTIQGNLCFPAFDPDSFGILFDYYVSLHLQQALLLAFRFFFVFPQLQQRTPRDVREGVALTLLDFVRSKPIS